MVSLEQDYPWITSIHQGFSGQHTANLARDCSLKLAHSDTTELQLILYCTLVFGRMEGFITITGLKNAVKWL